MSNRTAAFLVFTVFSLGSLGSPQADKTDQTAEQVAKIALERYGEKKFQVAARMYLQAYELSNSASTLWNAGKAFRAAADQALKQKDMVKSLAYREEGLAAWNRLIKNHKLPPKRLARSLEQIESLKIQIADEQRSAANIPPPPPAPSKDKLEAESKRFPVVITQAPASESKAGAWALLGTGAALGISSGIVYFLSAEKLSQVNAKIEDRKDGLIQTPRDQLRAEEAEINFQRNLSLGLGIGAILATLGGGIWLGTEPSIVPEITTTETGAKVGLRGFF